MAVAGVDRLVVVDPHTRDLEAILAVPVEPATAVPLLVRAFGGVSEDVVVVAPDLGAMKLAERFADLLDRPVAVVRKTRLSGDAVRAEHVIGDVRERRPVIVDDMISTGATIVAASRALLEAGCRTPVTVVATHGLFVDRATEALTGLPIGRVIVSDSVPPPTGLDLDLEVATIAPLLADAIGRLEAGDRLDDLESFH